MLVRQLAIAIALLGGAVVSGQTAASQASPPASVLEPPGGLKDDLSVWPNRTSFRNSDDWLWQHHEQLRQMRPRVLILNFANDVDDAGIRRHAEALIRAMSESTRYHGYSDGAAAPFIEYQIAKLVDLRDDSARAQPRRESSSRMPRKSDANPDEPALDYAALFSDEFAPRLGFADPRTAGRFLNLRELVHAGWVHELWFYAIHGAGERWPGLETCEMKQFYDERCRPIAGRHGSAGNGSDRTMPWIGRSFRVAFFNPHRGPGCAMENLGHTMEWIANSGSNAYYRKYFQEFADFRLDERCGLPFATFYETSYDRDSGDRMEYPEPSQLKIRWRGKEQTIAQFIVAGGSVHFPPGARWHYDLESPFTVLTTLETYRVRKNAVDKDEPRLFSREKFQRYQTLAPDCMGPWLVYWFQSMPGLNNRCLDSDGQPMRNWWPFLFY